jgi:hypothetical protein
MEANGTKTPLTKKARQNLAETLLTKKARQNLAQSAVMLAVFTVFWPPFSFWGFGLSVYSVLLCAAFTGAAVCIFIGALKAGRAIKALPDEEVSAADRRAEKRWNVIFILQSCSIGVAGAALGILGEYAYVPLAAALIVGLHYIPIGLLYRTKIHAAVAALTVLTGVFCITARASGWLGDETIGICSAAAACGTSVLGGWILLFLRKRGKE